MFEKFNASQEKKNEQQQKLIKALAIAWLENPLLPKIRVGVDNLVNVRQE